MDDEIRTAVFDFLVEELRVERCRLNPDVKIREDLGVDGDDGYDLLLAFAKRFDVDLGADFRTDEYFGPEAAMNPLSVLLYLVAVARGRHPARLKSITVQDLVESARQKRWRRATGPS